MEVRSLVAADRDTAIDVWIEAELTRPWNDPAADFDRALAGPTSAILGAFTGGALAATVMVGHDGHRGWVYYLAVRGSQRGSGLGRLMMDEAERWLRDRGAVKVNVMVRDANHATRGFYERLGYSAPGVTVLARWLVEPPREAESP